MNAIQRNITPLIVVLLVFAGCGKGGISVSSSLSSSSELNINGVKTSRKTITKMHDGITLKVETTTDVDIQNGHVTSFPKLALIKIEEIGGPEQRQAELRENAGKLELWIKENGSFRRGTAQEDVWLDRFLSEVTRK